MTEAATTYPLLSSDSHVFEPPDLWTTRCPGIDEVPRVERVRNRDLWMLGGHVMGSTAAAQNAGVRHNNPAELRTVGLFDDVPKGAYEPEARLAEQDVDGIGGEVLYTTVGLFLYGQLRDSARLSLLCGAYNDWLAEFCAHEPNRLKGMAMIDTDDIRGAVKELERSRNLGLVGAMIPSYPDWERPYEHPDYEPLWAAAADLEAPLALHVATNRPGPLPSLSFELPAECTQSFLTNLDYWVRMSLTDIILSGVFERHPTLMVGSVENELGWIPYFLFQLDYTYTDRLRRSTWPKRFDSGKLPSDYFRSNVFASFQEDPTAMPQRSVIGIDTLMWGSDYPHPESTYPKSREITSRVLADVPEPDREQILAGNTARVFGFRY